MQNIADADIKNVTDRYHQFSCDFSVAQFPKWLACDLCRTKRLEKSLPCYTCIKYGDFIFRLSYIIYDRKILFIMLYAKNFPVCDFTEVNESEGTLSSSPPNKDGRCCLGGVDFVTLVCVIFKHLAFREFTLCLSSSSGVASMNQKLKTLFLCAFGL